MYFLLDVYHKEIVLITVKKIIFEIEMLMKSIVIVINNFNRM